MGRQTLAFSFRSNASTGKSMRFIYYLSRHPIHIASSINLRNEKFVINIIETIHLDLLKNDLKCTSPTNQISKLTEELRRFSKHTKQI